MLASAQHQLGLIISDLTSPRAPYLSSKSVIYICSRYVSTCVELQAVGLTYEDLVFHYSDLEQQT